jgi:hypothetical protein
MSNEHVDPTVRAILAGVAPREAKRPMVAADERNRKSLEDAASVLCATNTHREVLQRIYDLGKNEGWIEATKDAIKRMGAV